MKAGGVSGSHNALAPSYESAWWWWSKAGHAILGGSTLHLLEDLSAALATWLPSLCYPFPKPSYIAFQVIHVTKYYFQNSFSTEIRQTVFPLYWGPKDATTYKSFLECAFTLSTQKNGSIFRLSPSTWGTKLSQKFQIISPVSKAFTITTVYGRGPDYIPTTSSTPSAILLSYLEALTPGIVTGSIL